MHLDKTIFLAEKSEDTTDSEEHIQIWKQTGEAKKSFTRGEEVTGEKQWQTSRTLASNQPQAEEIREKQAREESKRLDCKEIWRLEFEDKTKPRATDPSAHAQTSSMTPWSSVLPSGIWLMCRSLSLPVASS